MKRLIRGNRTSPLQEKNERRRTPCEGDATYGGLALRHDDERPGYVGAMLGSERRLVLVPVDPERPWAAFRRMRTWMKRSRKGDDASLSVFKAPVDREESNVISLRQRRSDGR